MMAENSQIPTHGYILLKGWGGGEYKNTPKQRIFNSLRISEQAVTFLFTSMAKKNLLLAILL